jgi:hypothetical protein
VPIAFTAVTETELVPPVATGVFNVAVAVARVAMTEAFPEVAVCTTTSAKKSELVVVVGRASVDP